MWLHRFPAFQKYLPDQTGHRPKRETMFDVPKLRFTNEAQAPNACFAAIQSEAAP
jgi:hypothetical protein